MDPTVLTITPSAQTRCPRQNSPGPVPTEDVIRQVPNITHKWPNLQGRGNALIICQKVFTEIQLVFAKSQLSGIGLPEGIREFQLHLSTPAGASGRLWLYQGG